MTANASKNSVFCVVCCREIRRHYPSGSSGQSADDAMIAPILRARALARAAISRAAADLQLQFAHDQVVHGPFGKQDPFSHGLVAGSSIPTVINELQEIERALATQVSVLEPEEKGKR